MLAVPQVASRIQGRAFEAASRAGPANIDGYRNVAPCGG